MIFIYILYIYKTHIYFNIQGVADHPYQPNISKTERDRQKYFRQKLYGFEGDIRWCH